MRCPKCGFISFDHLTSCTKCGKDTTEVATELQGTSIKVETPMFLSGALAAFTEREETFEEHAMEAEADEGIDFSMGEEVAEEEAFEMAEAEEEVDFSFEEEAEEAADITLAEAEAEEAGAVEPEKEADVVLEAEAEEEPETAAAVESFDELDFMGVADDEEEGGLEFDLEDFIEDLDDDKSRPADDNDDLGLDLDEEETK